jgi:hypothetical protein
MLQIASKPDPSHPLGMTGKGKTEILPLRGCSAIAALIRDDNKNENDSGRRNQSVIPRPAPWPRDLGFEHRRTNCEILLPLRGCFAIAALLRMTERVGILSVDSVIPRPAPWPRDLGFEHP